MKRKYKIFSTNIQKIYIGLSSDLLFYIAINIIFLTSVKGLTVQQMVLINTLSSLFYLVLQIPVLKIIEKIGNTLSVRIGSFFALLTTIICTFANSFFVIMISEVCYQLFSMFSSMNSVLLKNNLKLESKEDDYTEIKTKGLTLYSIFTAAIALMVGDIYAINRYLPMYLAIASAFITFVMSLFIKDMSSNNITTKTETPKFTLKIFTPIIVCAFVSGVLFMTPLGLMQSNSDLLRKNILEANLGDIAAARITSYVIFAARMVRILSCLIYQRTYKKIGKNIIPIMYIMLFSAISIIIIGAVLPINFVAQVVMISIGYALILACRDPYSIYESDTLLTHTPKENQQQVVSYISIVRKIASLLLGAILTAYINFGVLLMYALVAIGSVFGFVYVKTIKKYEKNS